MPSIPAFLAALPPALVYLSARSVGLLIVFVMARVNSRSPLDVLTSGDAARLLSIAKNGYSGVTSDHFDSFGHYTPTTALAFVGTIVNRVVDAVH
ncbi:MAG: hypothetical protein ACRDRS_13430 [Pseudonocardiaceae bacterium]